MKALTLIVLLAGLALPALAARADAGRYQAVLGDCAGCHGRNLAGGVVLATPFGKLVTPNITPDKATGIGDWSAEDFRQAMKAGIAPGNKLLYPAMPYPAYAHMRDGDVAALWTYLRTVKPVHNAVEVNQLRFPYNLRFMMRGWNLLFFSPRPVADDAGKSATWNRGAYLVNGAGHCSTCHSPKNMFGADTGAALSGASLSGWWAPDLTGSTEGLASWNSADIVQYLKTGRNWHAIASGPMAEAIENSTSQMTDGDLAAVAVYLKALPPGPARGDQPAADPARISAGGELYRVNCAACHGMDGAGEKGLFPPLARTAIVRQPSAESLARVVLAGAQGASTKLAPTGPAMPSFTWRLNDGQVADVLTYIRSSWGNGAAPVSADGVAQIRARVKSGQ